MNIPFIKMHGAGNDFVLIDDRALSFPIQDTEWISGIMQRHTGVGSEGLVLVQPSDEADFRMRFFNPDGGEVEMCGNGARCVARFANRIGAAGDVMQIDTVAGHVGAALQGDAVKLEMTEPTDWQLPLDLDLDGTVLHGGFVNSGVPHVVMIVDEVQALDLMKRGPAIRYHEQFQPAGTNANFVEINGPQQIRVRTYERGVEAETPACGTGLVASALIAARLGHVTAPVDVVCAFGDTLQVGFDLTDAGAENVTLTGGAVEVFEGHLTY